MGLKTKICGGDVRGVRDVHDAGASMDALQGLVLATTDLVPMRG